MVASTVVMPRDGSRALASFGSLRKAHESDLVVEEGRNNFAVKRIAEAVLFMIAYC